METLHGCVAFFALRDIQPREEITIDYEETYIQTRSVAMRKKLARKNQTK
jgi:SET domain-containing protein